MKKFVIISIILLLIGGTAFGVSLYHYLDVTQPLSTSETVVATSNEVKATSTVSTPDQASSVVPAQWQDNGIFSANYEKAYSRVINMTNEQMVGQLIVGKCPTDGTAETALSRYGLGGYYYTSDNFSDMTSDEIKQQIEKYQQNAKIPMIMAVTEEGGAHNTISDLDEFYDYTFMSARDTFEEGGMDAIKTAEQQKSELLSSLGINLNLAPVCDFAQESTQIMYSRSLGGTLSDVEEYATTVTAISQAKNVSVALKHFPGYGTIPDTDESIVTDTRESYEFETQDFKPFEAGIKTGAHFVMMSNVVVESLDDEHTASLSKDIHTTLRDKLNFTGIIITDNLSNADYSDYADGKDVATAAILAGNDMIITDDYETAYRAVLNDLNNGTINKDDIVRACMRVVAYKYTAGILK